MRFTRWLALVVAFAATGCTQHDVKRYGQGTMVHTSYCNLRKSTTGCKRDETWFHAGGKRWPIEFFDQRFVAMNADRSLALLQLDHPDGLAVVVELASGRTVARVRTGPDNPWNGYPAIEKIGWCGGAFLILARTQEADVPEGSPFGGPDWVGPNRLLRLEVSTGRPRVERVFETKGPLWPRITDFACTARGEIAMSVDNHAEQQRSMEVLVLTRARRLEHRVRLHEAGYGEGKKIELQGDLGGVRRWCVHEAFADDRCGPIPGV